MTISLSYDSQLSRVRVTGVVPGVRDTFTRTAVDSWGSSDSGHAWTTTGGAAADFDVASGVGTQTHPTASVNRRSLIALNHADVDFSVTVKTDKLAVGAEQVAEAIGRYADSSNFYSAYVAFTPAAAVVLQIRKVVAGVATALTSVTTGLTHVANTAFSVRLYIVGTELKAKVWLASSQEPAAWTSTANDSSLTAAGSIGLSSGLVTGTSNTPVVFSWDTLTTRGDAYVERSTNQVVWSQVRGGQVDGTANSGYTVDDYEFNADILNYYRIRVLGFVETASMTPTLDGVWLKFISRPFLNTRIQPWGDLEWRRRSRSGVFEVVGRSLPVSVSDVRLSRQGTLQLIAETVQDYERLDLILSGGDQVFLHAPANSPLPTMYADVGDVAEPSPVPGTFFFMLPLTEVAAPAADIVGATATYQTIVNNYATYQSVLSTFTTYQDLLEEIGQPGDIVVP